MCVYVCGYPHSCGHTQRPLVLSAQLPFWDKVSHSDWSSLIWLDWLFREPLGLAWVLLYWCYRQCASLDTWFVFGCWGSKLKSCCLCDSLSRLEFLVRLCFLRSFCRTSFSQLQCLLLSVCKVSVSGRVYLPFSLSGWLGRGLVIATWQGPGPGEMIFISSVSAFQSRWIEFSEVGI